ncbi:MAG TPA: invasion associated locus B family protein [Xanthobacteraceae bacterium]
MRGPASMGRPARHLAASMVLAGAIALMQAGQPRAQAAQGPAAWRVECIGDGKTLECRAIQQIVNPNRQLIAQVQVRYAPEAKAAVMSIQLPLGLNLTEPVLIKVDNGPPERQPIQTCDNNGCLASLTMNDKFLASLRTGADLKLTVQDASKKPIEMSLPLLGFGIAYDKAK